jgi:hypothetical protein
MTSFLRNTSFAFYWVSIKTNYSVWVFWLWVVKFFIYDLLIISEIIRLDEFLSYGNMFCLKNVLLFFVNSSDVFFNEISSLIFLAKVSSFHFLWTKQILAKNCSYFLLNRGYSSLSSETMINRFLKCFKKICGSIIFG